MMRRILPLSLLSLTLLGGVAFADRGHSSRGRDHQTVRDHRDQRGRVARDRRVVQRRPVYASNGRFVFHNGVSHRYTRPVIRQRYFDYRYRPRVLVENYTPVAGYVWVSGQWQWNGREWLWTAGHYEIDASYYAY
ncbi:MAG: hypothetical protein ACTHU0_20370 [Kofleriaceae bacterium]